MSGQDMWAKCGHPRTAENTKVVRKGAGTTCRACFREMDKQYRRAARLALSAASGKEG
jgi:hypothetical protein